MNQVSDAENPITQLARLMEQFNLEEGELARDGVKVRFARRKKQTLAAAAPVIAGQTHEDESEDLAAEQDESEAKEPAGPGTPILSPMTGIYYVSSGPNAPPYVKVGSHFEAGEVIGLIEAMKVFNEVTATEAGTVVKISAETAKVINQGDPILYYKPE